MKFQLLSMLTCALLMSACLTPEEQASLTRAQSKGGSQVDNGGNTGAPPSVGAGQKFALSTPPTRTLNLNTTTAIPMQIQAAANFTGNVNLAVDYPELKARDTLSTNNDAFVITVSPTTVSLTPNQIANFTVTVRVTEQAPSFTTDHFHINADEVGGGANAASESAMADITVTNVIEIPIMGVVTNSGRTDFTNFPLSTAVRAHAGGVKLRFCNLDQVNQNVIHGTSSIPHQGTGANQTMTTSPDGVTCGSRLYEPTINSPATGTLTGQFYLHNDSPGTDVAGIRRTIIFTAL